MFHKNLTAEQRIERAHVALMNNPLTMAFAGVMMIGKTEVRDDMPTAATDGVNTIYGRVFVESLSEPELNAVVLHENLHKVYQHAWMWQDLFRQDPNLTNMAADYVINIEIVDASKQDPSFLQMPSIGCLYDPQYRGMDTMQVFEKLKQGGDDDNGSGGQGQQGFDEHNWEEAQSMSQEEKDQIKREIDNAIRQGAMIAGKLGGQISRGLEDLMDAKVNWKEQLREFISATCAGKDDSTWRKPNRRWLAEDIYMPSTISETVGRIVIGVDTSGSVGDRELREFMSEVVGLCNSVKPELVDLIYWDSEVAGHEVYTEDGLLMEAVRTSSYHL